jgi:hypothetical protein
MDAKDLRTGDIVLVSWPGSNSGANEKRAMVQGISKDGRRVRVLVAKTTPKGEYTGRYGTSARTFYDFEVLERVD